MIYAMHNHHIIGSAGMDQESRLSHTAGGTYEDGTWVDMNAAYQHHHTSMPDYNHGFNNYMPPISHGLPSESLSRMPPPPTPQHMQPPPPQTTHPQLPVLIMPSHPTWPSMLTNPGSYHAHHHPHNSPLAMPPVPMPLKASKLPTIAAPSQPRKTLTDDDRRRMCQYAEDHPNTKQTEIGAMFGVERSTVSKVLRNKDKYLFPEDRSHSPIRRNKGKGVDIEKALTNYIRNAQKSGSEVTDAEIKEKVKLFSATMGNSADGLLKASSSSWLEKFKQKNGIGSGKLVRRASETNIPDTVRVSPSLVPSHHPKMISSASPVGRRSLSPLSANRSDDERDGMNNYMDFASESGGYKPSHSQSTTSLSSAFTDGPSSSFPGSALSPNGPFTFSPDTGSGEFLAAGQGSRPMPEDAASNFQRPRSQTFPTLDLEYVNQPQATDPLTPRYQVSSTAPPSALESPQLRHSHSHSGIAGGSMTRPLPSNTTLSSTNSPTQEDARRAADILLSFIQRSNGFVDRNEYLVVAGLKDKLHSPQAQLVSNTPSALGGLDRIPEGDSEMSNAPPPPAIAPKAESSTSLDV